MEIPPKPVRRSSFLVKYAGNVITHKRKTHSRWLCPAMHACFSTVLKPICAKSIRWWLVEVLQTARTTWH